MTDPIGTAQERELIERLTQPSAWTAMYREDDGWAEENDDSPREAADALQSRIAEAEMWKRRAFELECKFGDLKGAYVESAALQRRPT